MKLEGIGFELRVPEELGEMTLPWVEELVGVLRGALGGELENELRHTFTPQGSSLVQFGSSARCAIHTWPEHRALSVDVWMDPQVLAQRGDLFEELLRSRSLEVVGRHRLVRAGH